ncbi:MAG: FIG00817564: hypothetical protein, partial [uncultured Nocardioidaceae bacterium]
GRVRSTQRLVPAGGGRPAHRHPALAPVLRGAPARRATGPARLRVRV